MFMLEDDRSAMGVAEAQYDMRIGYYGGAPGVLASALVWFCAPVTALFASPQEAVWTLFIGAVFIHPLAVLVCRGMGRPGKHAKGNPLGPLVMASTFWLIFSCPLAYAVSLMHIEWFFPAMLLVIGGRYLVFATIYGARVYWACGFALAIGAYVAAAVHATPGLGAFTGAVIEAFFSVVIFGISRNEITSSIRNGEKIDQGRAPD